MGQQVEILREYIREQIAIEERLYNIIEDQVSEIDEVDFAAAKDLLTNIKLVLEQQFQPLNKLLDKLEEEQKGELAQAPVANGECHGAPFGQEQKGGRISRILRDDYSALNLITMSNTQLHTTALALDSQEVASVALRHLENLAPLVVRMGELVHEVAARELRAKYQNVDLSIAQIALKNTQQAWRKVS